MKTALALTLGVAFASIAAKAAPIFTDDFESYPAQAAPNTALDAVWPIVTAAGTTTSFITAGPAAPDTTQVISFPAQSTSNVGRRYHDFTNTVPSAAGILEYSFDFYDTTGTSTASYRQYGEFYANDEANANGLIQLLAMGVNNSATAGIPTPGGTAQAFSGSKYQARVAFGVGAGWFNLAASRSVGWHNFKISLDGTKIDFYVDGVLDTSFTNGGAVTGVSAGYNQARMSSGLSSTAGGAFYDNVSIAVVPEPAALSLLGVTALSLIRRRR